MISFAERVAAHIDLRQRALALRQGIEMQGESQSLCDGADNLPR